MENVISSDVRVSSGYSMVVQSGGTAIRASISSGSMILSNGGCVISANIMRNGVLFVSSGGVAESASVDAEGRMHVFSGGMAINVRANSRAAFGFDVAPDTYVQGSSGSSRFEMNHASLSR